MQVHYSMDELPVIPAPVVTMGSFDGVHAGHRVIISRLNSLARKAEGQSVLITFHPHPRKVLYPDTAGKDLQLISTLEEKCIILEETGLDHLIVMDFTREFARTTSMEFVEHFLYRRLHAHTIVVGFNHFFGHNKEGDFDSLYRSRERFAFGVEEIPEQEIQNETVSSTKIRKALKEGNIQRANAYLEHHFLVRAGTSAMENGFHLHIDDENKLIPPQGSYAASLRSTNRTSKALLRISDNDLQIFPLGDGPGPGPCNVHFHKYLSGAERKLETGLQEVEELIY